MAREERRDFHRSLLEQGQASGLLVYDGEQAVAWCQFGPAALFTTFDRNRVYKTLDIPPEWKPQWRISCLFVDKHRRREGLSTFALHAALEHIRTHGGGVVEAFPFEIEGVQRPSYTGSVAMYEHEGFARVCPLGKVMVLMRLVVSPA
jgi:GNAT superfamily N-acetyltransferase